MSSSHYDWRDSKDQQAFWRWVDEDYPQRWAFWRCRDELDGVLFGAFVGVVLVALIVAIAT